LKYFMAGWDFKQDIGVHIHLHFKQVLHKGFRFAPFT
jgi:hypothetical protein